MKFVHVLNNIKCGGCGHSITKKVSSIDGISDVSVNPDNGEVCFDAPSKAHSEIVLSTLAKMGYTETNPDLIDTAKSYVSCMIGKVSQKMEN